MKEFNVDIFLTCMGCWYVGYVDGRVGGYVDFVSQKVVWVKWAG